MHSISGHVPRRDKVHGSGAHSRALLRLYENESKLTWKAYLAGSTASLWFYVVDLVEHIVHRVVLHGWTYTVNVPSREHSRVPHPRRTE